MVRAILPLFFVVVFSQAAVAQPEEPKSPRVWRVITDVEPPFVIENSDGTFSGLAVAAWREVATTLNINYDIVRTPGDALVADVKAGNFDVVLVASTRSGTEKLVDVTHAYYNASLAIAIPQRQASGGWIKTVKKFVSWRFAKLIIALIGVLLLVGFAMYFVERKRNHHQFGGSAKSGIWAGVWWSAVTMTTVGYGDKSPVTVPGRLLGLAWMFIAIFVISSFTANIASSLTVEQLDGGIESLDDLRDVRVGIVETQTYRLSSKQLAKRNISVATSFTNIEEGLQSLARGDIDALVHEEPTLSYHISEHYRKTLQLAPVRFAPHGWGMALANGSPHRESVDIALLKYVESDEWQRQLRAFGTQD